MTKMAKRGQRTDLRRQAFFVQHRISDRVLREMFGNPVVLVRDDGMLLRKVFDAEEWELRLRQDVLATDPEVLEFSHPTDWWQAFKARWFPRWALRRWPARMVSHRIEKMAIYPEIPIPHGTGHYACIPLLRDYQREWSDRGEQDE